MRWDDEGIVPYEFLKSRRITHVIANRWCSAQRIKIAMTASGSHTLVYRTLVWSLPGIPSGHNPSSCLPLGEGARRSGRMRENIVQAALIRLALA